MSTFVRLDVCASKYNVDPFDSQIGKQQDEWEEKRKIIEDIEKFLKKKEEATRNAEIILEKERQAALALALDRRIKE